MAQKKVNVFTVPKILRALYEYDSPDSFAKNFNKLLCTFISPVLFISAIGTLVFGIFIFYKPVADILIESITFFSLGVCFQILLRTDLNVKLSNHLISLLYSIVLFFSVARFYHIVGPALWTFAFIQVVFSLAQNSKIMLTYSTITMFSSISYITLVSTHGNFTTDAYYSFVQLGLFILLFIISRAIYSINYKRIEKIDNQINELKTQISERKKAEEKNLRMALYDQLTGLPNRTLFTDRLSQAIDFSKRNSLEIYVLFIDIDLFKLINDTMGHSSGDDLLKQIGDRLNTMFRGSDAVCRVGGDEFLIMLQDVKSEQYILTIAKRILEKVNSPFMVNNHQINISCSIGISKYPDDGQDVEALIKRADIAMYKAKQDGKNRFALYSKNLEQMIYEEMEIVNSLQNAIAKKEFRLHYQPQINGDTKEVIGFEALIRWEHPTKGFLSPAEFIPASEKSGLIVPIGEWVLRTACQQNKKWQEQGLPFVPMAVNISINQITSNALFTLVSQVLEETGLEPKYLELEITETILVKETEVVKENLNNIRNLGVKITIDDFGTGYSAIQYLKYFPVDRIKIPMDFIHGISNNIKDESIITVILALAESLGIGVVAEGVETENQYDFLMDRLCNTIQGFLFCKPMPADDVVKYIENNAKK